MRILGVDWQLDVRYREKSFSGRVRIEIEDAPIPLELDAEKLEIGTATLDGRPVSLLADPQRRRLSLAGVPPGRHTLEIAYRGRAESDSLVGMYVAPAGSSYVLTTMSFPTGSRRLLPSFEHPAVKAVYRLTLTTDAEDQVIFNTAPQSTRTVSGRKEWTFAPTPRMSAYLLYLGVGPFDLLSINRGARQVRVAASPGRAAAGQFAAERAHELLAAYEDYYNVPYPLPKLDLVALENFWAGAMENWGAITGRAELFLLDGSTSLNQRREALATISHEIAHQWFGDLVTNAWWDDFWLNESFATFVGYRIIERRFPEEDAEKAMILRWISTGYDLDSLRSTHPIHVPVDSPEELGEHADAVTYGKGAAVLRMIESYIGDAAFRHGVADYLRRFGYANAKAEDLWDALGRASEKPVAAIMREWITRPGHPVVHLRWEGGQLRMRQERFLKDGAHVPGVWPIPLRLRDATGERSVLLDREELAVDGLSRHGLRVDPGRKSFVRIHLDGPMLDEQLGEFPRLDPVDQWGAVTDLAALTFSLEVPFERFLALLDRAGAVSDDLAVRALLARLGEMRLAAHGIPEFEDAARRFLTLQVDRVGVDPRPGEPESSRVLRGALAIARSRYDPAFAGQLAGRYGEYDALPSDLQGAVATAYARIGSGVAFDELIARLRRTSSNSGRDRLTRAMGAIEDGPALRRALDLGGTADVPSSALYVLMLSAASNLAGGSTFFDWFVERAPSITEMWSGTPLMSLFLTQSMAAMGVDRADAVRAFFADHTPPDAIAGARAGLEDLALTTRLRQALLDRRPVR